MSFFVLVVFDIERCDLNIKSNNSSHHTDLYGEERLIVRRGQPFNVTLHPSAGSKDFELGETSLTLIVETGIYVFVFPTPDVKRLDAV